MSEIEQETRETEESGQAPQETPSPLTEEPDAAPAEAADEADTVDYAALEQEDLAALARLFPEMAGMDSLAALDDPVRYGELRDLGLSPEEAYRATNRRAARQETRAHLRSAVPRPAGTGIEGMSAGEMRAARELFDGISDAEIRQLYRRVNS